MGVQGAICSGRERAGGRKFHTASLLLGKTIKQQVHELMGVLLALVSPPRWSRRQVLSMRVRMRRVSAQAALSRV